MTADHKSPSANSRFDPWVFREARTKVDATLEIAAFQRKLARAATSDRNELIELMIWSGELECALTDAGLPSAPTFSRITDALATTLYGRSDLEADLRALATLLDCCIQLRFITLSRPEGFAYYAIQPDDFARSAGEEISLLCGNRAAIVGIRSIGVTLSAVVAASLLSKRKKASRITIRPEGHPYDRVANFDPEHSRWIDEEVRQGARFLIVDEGPGRSGSTFLSVADALTRHGVAAERIIMVGSREPDASQLSARNGSERWLSYKFLAVSEGALKRVPGSTNLSGGAWRAILFSSEADWPACWPQMERRKGLSSNRKHFFKFEGMGRYGEQVRRRAQNLAAAGFAPTFANLGSGWVQYPLLKGRPLNPGDVSPGLLEKVASYCGFRAEAFPETQPRTEFLRDMLSFNLNNSFGVELRSGWADELDSGPLVVTDGQMQLHEWIIQEDSAITKTDSLSHGDDHFFPGPCDVSWDLAGIAVEWNLPPAGTAFLCDSFHKLSGRRLDLSLPIFELAYSVFRHGICEMALSTVRGSPEELRLTRAQKYYRNRIEKRLAAMAPAGVKAMRRTGSSL